jgi:predicted NodU family carbamoyl transferase
MKVLGVSALRLALVNRTRFDIPAVTHLDYSARIQTVSRKTNPRFYALLTAFEARTGCGVSAVALTRCMALRSR